MDAPITSWSFYRGEYATAGATLEAQYGELLARDPVLQHAVAQARVAELAIEARMAQLGANEERSDG
jgi:hypothetical protein